MILLDTCVLVFDALTPERLSAAARSALEQGEQDSALACADISLWEIAMLVDKKRIKPGVEVTRVMPESDGQDPLGFTIPPLLTQS